MKKNYLLLIALCFSGVCLGETLDSKIIGVSTTENAKKIETTCSTMLKNKEYEKLENFAKSLDTDEEKMKDDSGHIQIYQEIKNNSFLQVGEKLSIIKT